MHLMPAGDVHERELYQARTYEPGTLALMDAILRPGDVVVDVGANLGLVTLHAAQRVGPLGRVLALEPHPVMFQRLEQNIALNDFANVRAVNVAAGAERDRRPIFDVPSVNIGRASLISPKTPHILAGMVDVQPLDDIARELLSIRFLKIDVEGFERDVVAGAREILARLPIVCMEVSAAVDHTGDPLAAHDAIMTSGQYRAFNFSGTKARASALIEVPGRDALSTLLHDNVVYIPNDLVGELTSSLFLTTLPN